MLKNEVGEADKIFSKNFRFDYRCNTKSGKSGIIKVNELRRYVLTYIKEYVITY